MKNFSKVAIIGVPQDLGASRRGVDMGPSAIRIAGLQEKIIQLGYEVEDFGNIHCHDFDTTNIKNTIQNPKMKYLDQIKDTCIHLKSKIEHVISSGYFPLILGGDHSITIGTMAGMAKLHSGKTGIIWIDAHADFNNEVTTPTGNIHGMPFAVINNRGNIELTEIGPSPTVSEENSVLIAARDIDPAEAAEIKNSRISVFTMKNIDELGFSTVAKQALKVATNNLDYVHISFDIDALDPREAPGTGTTVPGGLTYREAHLLMELVHESGKLASFELVEVNPTLDVRNKTAELAVGLIASALGKRII